MQGMAAASQVLRDSAAALSWSGLLGDRLRGGDVAVAAGVERIDAARSSGPVSVVKAASWALWAASTHPVVAPPYGDGALQSRVEATTTGSRANPGRSGKASRVAQSAAGRRRAGPLHVRPDHRQPAGQRPGRPAIGHGPGRVVVGLRPGPNCGYGGAVACRRDPRHVPDREHDHVAAVAGGVRRIPNDRAFPGAGLGAVAHRSDAAAAQERPAVPQNAALLMSRGVFWAQWIRSACARDGLPDLRGGRRGPAVGGDDAGAEPGVVAPIYDGSAGCIGGSGRRNWHTTASTTPTRMARSSWAGAPTG